jgi:hypothetical protein
MMSKTWRYTEWRGGCFELVNARCYFNGRWSWGTASRLAFAYSSSDSAHAPIILRRAPMRLT